MKNAYISTFKAYLNPITSLLLLVWSFYMISVGKLVPVGLVCVFLALYFRIAKKILPLLLWLAIPTLIVLSVLFGYIDASYITIKIVLIALSAIIAFTSPKPQHVAYLTSKIGIPPIIGFSQLFVLRLIQVLKEALAEAMNAAIGRGIKSRIKIIMLMPIPLLVHTISLSMYLAEALYIKYPPKMRTWTDKARVSGKDISLLLYLALTFILHNVGIPFY